MPRATPTCRRTGAPGSSSPATPTTTTLITSPPSAPGSKAANERPIDTVNCPPVCHGRSLVIHSVVAQAHARLPRRVAAGDATLPATQEPLAGVGRRLEQG